MPVWENRRSAGADAIFALVCGYATGVREDKPLAFLQAITDDSGSETGDRRLFLAGYLQRAEVWALFSDAWKDELKSGKRIDYLKMSEANAFEGEFRGWTKSQRDEKLRGLIRVARHFKPISFHVSVSRKMVDELFKPVAPRGVANAHFLCNFGVVSAVSRYAAAEGGNIPIDFIFDKQTGVEDDVRLFFDYMKRNLPRKARKLINDRPSFKDDKQFCPLQAADLLVWHLRRNHDDNGSWANGEIANKLISDHGHLHNDLDEMVPIWAKKFPAIPGADQTRTKSQWRRMKEAIRVAASRGYIPPHGTIFKNLVYGAREKLNRLLDR